MFRSNRAALVRRFMHDDSAATAVEYALLAAGIAGTVITVVWNLGADVKQQLYEKLVALF